MSIKTKSIFALLVALVIILAVKPVIIHNIYNSILGRVVLIAIVVFCAMHNVTLGLLATLIIIIVLNKYGKLTEGMDTMDTPQTIGEDNTATTGDHTVLTRAAVKQRVSNNQSSTGATPGARISELKANAAAAGIDKEDIRNAIQSKDSNTIPLDHNVMKSDDNVNAFTPSMLNNSTSLTEGFCPCAAVAF